MPLENLAGITAELEENKLKLDVIESKQVKLSTTLEPEAGSLAHLRHELEQAEVWLLFIPVSTRQFNHLYQTVAKQISEAKDNTICDLNYELLQKKKDLSHNKETFERQLLTASTELIKRHYYSAAT
ncbi:hypothetical protein C0993_005698 [Termitomyces sp. T159_Od127]|nr:hypothetical protein C0993_005698 [Termitomyces sp. T159_Od127]